MAAVAMVHEHMHQRAREQQQKRQVEQRAVKMSLVLRNEKVTRDQEESDQDPIE